MVWGGSDAFGRPRHHAIVSEPTIYSGICGASAAAAIGNDLFIVADDEANELRVYPRRQGGPPLRVTRLTSDLALDRGSAEVDIEGAARIGNRIYWISSHSRNQAGKEHANRYRFFATDLKETNGQPQVVFTGRPYKNLLADLIAAPALQRFDFRAASRVAPKTPGGLNIEGLCATESGELLIGFRNPVPNGDALLIPLLNPDGVISGEPAKLGKPILLDLNGLGVRDLGYWQGEYFIIAGASDGGGKSRLYQWSGGTSRAKHLKEIDLKGLNPEAIVLYPDTGLGEIQLLSDDSGKQDGRSCKDLSPASRRFRSISVTLENKRGPGR